MFYISFGIGFGFVIGFGLVLLLVQKVPAKTWRTTMNTWNGYHSVHLDQQSRDATIFLTPFDGFRYLTYPQGQKVSGDAYTVRYDKILMDFMGPSGGQCSCVGQEVQESHVACMRNLGTNGK